METCNETCIAETIVNTGESKKIVESIIDHHSKFIVQTMKAGAYESVRVLHFGIFKAKLKELQTRALLQMLPFSTTRIKGGKPR